MTVAFNVRSASLVINPHLPSADDPFIAAEFPHAVKSLDDFLNNLRRLVDGNKAWFFCTSSMRATGAVELTGAARDDARDWELGFLQAQWIETNWGHYKADWTDGAAIKGGSLLLQRGKRPARPRQSCRDTVHGNAAAQFWYDQDEGTAGGAAGKFPQPLTVAFTDQPADGYPAVVWNSLTKQDNFLREAQIEFHFCTALVLRGPAGRFHHLKHFYWNVHWQATFQPVDFANARYGEWLPPTVVRGGATEVNVGPVLTGEPQDSRFLDVLTGAHETETCNDVFRKAQQSVLTPPYIGRRESKDRDHEFDVRV